MFAKSLSTILSGFTKVQTELDNFVKAHSSQLAKATKNIQTLEDERDVIESEMEKAATIVRNLDKLLGEE